MLASPWCETHRLFSACIASQGSPCTRCERMMTCMLGGALMHQWPEALTGELPESQQPRGWYYLQVKQVMTPARPEGTPG